MNGEVPDEWQFAIHLGLLLSFYIYICNKLASPDELQFAIRLAMPAYYNADILLKNIVFNAHPEGIKLNWDFPNSLTRDQKAKQEVCIIFVFETHHNQRGKVVTSER